jgi:hypothetical protein
MPLEVATVASSCWQASDYLILRRAQDDNFRRHAIYFLTSPERDDRLPHPATSRP